MSDFINNLYRIRCVNGETILLEIEKYLKHRNKLEWDTTKANAKILKILQLWKNNIQQLKLKQIK